MARKKLPIRYKKGRRESRLKSKYSYVQALYLSFFKSELYVDVKQRWRGVNMLYLLLVCSILSVPWALLEAYKQNQYYQTVVIPSVNKIPNLKIKNGEVQFEEKMPFVITEIKTGKPVVVIDTTGKTKPKKLATEQEAVIFITKNEVHLRVPQMPPDIERIAKGTNGTIGAKEFLFAMDRARTILMYVMFPSLVMILFSTAFIMLTILSFLVMFFSKMLMKYDLNYRDTIRLGCVAATPQLVVLFIFHFLGWQNHTTGLILFCVLLAYFIYALRANKHAAKGLITLE